MLVQMLALLLNRIAATFAPLQFAATSAYDREAITSLAIWGLRVDNAAGAFPERLKLHGGRKCRISKGTAVTAVV